MTDNLISGQTMTFVSLQVGDSTFETKPKPVKHKQQAIEFSEDFTCPVAEDWLTIRTPPEDGSPTSSAIPVTVKLHRKGLIDSEVIATGKIQLPVESTEIDNISVGLFQVDEEKHEIAIAKLSVVISLAKADDGGPLGAIIAEIESMMLEYARGRLDNSNPTVADTLQRFLTAVTPFRRLCESTLDVLSWRKSYVQSWLFLLTITLFPPIGLIAACLVMFSSAFHVPLPLVMYIPSNKLVSVETESPEKSVELNVLFLFHLMTRLAYLSRRIASIKSSVVVACVLVTVYYLPLEWLLACVMAYNTFLAKGVLRYVSNRFGWSIVHHRVVDAPTQAEGETCVHENQRWWFGKWSDMLIGEEAGAWEDTTRMVVNSKDTLLPPIGAEWTSKWQVREVPDCDQGWLYGRDFASGLNNTKRELADFVRSRQWVRTYRTLSTT